VGGIRFVETGDVIWRFSFRTALRSLPVRASALTAYV
jgi:hypothetical protein